MTTHTLDLDALRAKRDRLNALIAAAEAYYELEAQPAASRPAEARPRRRAAGLSEATEAAVTAVLDELGPSATGTILLNVDRDTLGLTGDNASNILSARLSNSPKFNGNRAHGWWFADRPLPVKEVESIFDGVDDDL